jgi:hypothetical protein
MKGVCANPTQRFLSGGGLVRKITAIYLLSLTCVLIAGCGLVWQSIQGAALDRDLTQVLEANDLEQRELQCRMVASSRTGFCVMDATEEDEESARVYESARRPETLRLANGTAFEYLLVSFRQDLGTMCIQVSYAYG